MDYKNDDQHLNINLLLCKQKTNKSYLSQNWKHNDNNDNNQSIDPYIVDIEKEINDEFQYDINSKIQIIEPNKIILNDIKFEFYKSINESIKNEKINCIGIIITSKNSISLLNELIGIKNIYDINTRIQFYIYCVGSSTLNYLLNNNNIINNSDKQNYYFNYNNNSYSLFILGNDINSGSAEKLMTNLIIPNIFDNNKIWDIKFICGEKHSNYIPNKFNIDFKDHQLINNYEELIVYKTIYNEDYQLKLLNSIKILNLMNNQIIILMLYSPSSFNFNLSTEFINLLNQLGYQINSYDNKDENENDNENKNKMGYYCNKNNNNKIYLFCIGKTTYKSINNDIIISDISLNPSLKTFIKTVYNKIII